MEFAWLASEKHYRVLGLREHDIIAGFGSARARNTEDDGSFAAEGVNIRRQSRSFSRR